ncbi:MAG: sigma-70 family RNA polymerase sigma factor [Planctomycetota bacterium]
MEHAQPIRPEDLLQHLSWAQSLARRLVADDATADDVVQDSMTAALRRPPRDDRPVRPWLARVVGNAARQRRRSEGRRAARERSAARDEALPSAAELTGRAEAQRSLIDALLELDERSREVVLLRYFQDLSSAEIARRTGEPAATVRSRLKRALDVLRDRLDARFGDGDGGWRAALAPLVVPRVAAPAAAAGGGGLASPAASAGASAAAFVAKALLAVGTLAAVAFVAVSLVGGIGSLIPVPMEEVAFRPIAAPAAIEGSIEGPAPTPQKGETERVALAPAASTESQATAGASRSTMRFVDPTGAPLAGVEVQARRSTLAVSGADGRATIDVEFAGPFLEGQLRVSRAGIASNVLQAPGTPGETSDLGDIVLHPGGSISGVVTREDGAALAGVRVWVEGKMERESSSGGIQVYRSTGHGAAEDRTDAEGRFRLDGVLAGEVRVEVESDDDLYQAKTGRVEVRAGQESVGLEIVAREVDPRRRIEGVVVDESGAPVAFANVRVSWKTLLMGGSSSSLSRDDGTFRLLVRAGARGDLEVRGRGDEPATARLERVRGGTHDVRIVLRASRMLPVRALLPGGAAAQRAEVLSVTSDEERGGEVDAEEGLFQLRVPDRPFRVVVRVDGHDAATSERIDPAALPEVVELALRAIPTLSGRVTAGGEPVAGATVEVRELARGKVRVAGLPSLVEPDPIATTTTREDGTYELTLRESANIVVRAAAEGLAPAELDASRYDPLVGRAGADLALTAGGSIEGIVQDGDGLRQVRVVMVSRGDGVVRTVRTDADGAFRIDHLTPGPWMLRLTSTMMEGGASSSSFAFGARFKSIEPDVIVSEGRVTRFDVRTGELAPRVSVRGRVSLDGFDPARLRVLLNAYEAFGAGDTGGTARVRADGTFEVRGGAPGIYALALVDGDVDDADALRFVARLELGAGETPFSLTGSFGEVVVGDGADREMERLLWRGPSGVAAIAPLPAKGEVARFPAGTVERVGVEAVLMAELDAVEVLESAALAPGGRVTLGE